MYEQEKHRRAGFDVQERESGKATNNTFAAQPVELYVIQPSNYFKKREAGFCVLDAHINLDVHAALFATRSVEPSYLQEIEDNLSWDFP